MFVPTCLFMVSFLFHLFRPNSLYFYLTILEHKPDCNIVRYNFNSSYTYKITTIAFTKHTHRTVP